MVHISQGFSEVVVVRNGDKRGKTRGKGSEAGVLLGSKEKKCELGWEVLLHPDSPARRRVGALSPWSLAQPWTSGFPRAARV